MTKWQKRMGQTSHTDDKRNRPVPSSARKAKRNKREFPPHWEVSAGPAYGDSGKLYFHIRPHRFRGVNLRFDAIPKELRHDLAGTLEFLDAHFPHTAHWPVRFVSGPEIEIEREILK